MEYGSLTIESPPPEYAMRVHGEDSRPLVTLKTDGTIIVHEMGADVEAATRFWDALRFQGKTLREERDAAVSVKDEYGRICDVTRDERDAARRELCANFAEHMGLGKELHEKSYAASRDWQYLYPEKPK